MIPEKILHLLQKNIRTFANRINRDYLICFNSGKNGEWHYEEISIEANQYWHLLGCKLKTDKTQEEVFEQCLRQEDISEDLILVHDIKLIEAKAEVFEKVFDFVKMAKYIRIGYVEDVPEQYTLRMAIGDTSGIIGYKFPKRAPHRFMLPLTCQKKPLRSVTKFENKIVFILGKSRAEEEYSVIEYEIKTGVAEAELKGRFPEIRFCFASDEK